MKKFFLFLSVSFTIYALQGQIVVNTTPTAQQLAELLAGSNLVVSNASLTGAASAHGSFSNGGSQVGMTSGVLLSTGNVTTAPGPNTVGNTSNELGTAGTTQMTALAGATTYDAITLEFDFNVQSDFIQFNYIFASEEYPEYAPPVSSSYNDVFAFFISGPGITGEENIALIPNTSTAVAINNINAITNTQYYVDNAGGTDVSFDAFTTMLTARRDGLTPCSTYHLKLVIADAGDRKYNSAVLLQENSLVQGVVEVNTETINADSIALEGCIEASFSFSLDQVSATDKTINFQIAGTATNGVDYSPIASSLTIPAGQTQASVFIHAISDGIPEGQESILIIYKPEVCSDWDTAYLFIDDAQPIIYSLAGTNLDCYGDHSGEILINSSGGFPPYTYHLTNPFGQINQYTANPVTGLEAGQYKVYVYDSYGCKAEALVIGGLFNAGTTFLPDGSGVTYSSTLNITGFNTGATLTSLSMLQNICLNMEHSYLGDLLITMQAPGGQSVQLSSGGGGSCDLGEPIATGPIDGSASSYLTDPGIGYDYCFNVSPMYGTMVSESNNFTRNYTDAQGHNYTDNYLPAGSYTPEQSLSNLIGTPLNGTWTVFVTDQMGLDNGYIFNWTISFVSDLPDTIVILSQPDSIGISSFITNATCGAANGSINISANGDFSPYTYLWNTGAITEDLSAVTAGAYSVTVTDTHNCHDSAFFAVSNTSSLSLTSVVSPVLCTGGNNGSINISVFGGIPTYSYNWSNGATSEDVVNLAAGSYSVTITDAIGCQIIRLFQVTTMPPVQITLINQQSEMCSLGNGLINISASGGSGSYGYLWNNGSNGSSISALHTGTYSVTVTDAYGCSATNSWFIPNDVSNCAAYCYLTVTENSVIDDQCGQSVGSIDVSINDAVQPYLVQWSNGASTEDLSGLTQGNYSITVTDANQCVASIAVNVGNNTGSLAASVNTIQNETCGSSNGSVDISVSGGALPYSFVWSNGTLTEDLSGISAGNYSLTITDANLCQVVKTYNVLNDVGTLQVTAALTHESCGAVNGAINQTVTGGFGTSTYTWSNSSAMQDITGLSAGTYSCTITDAGGCSMQRVYNIINLAGPLAITNTTVTNEQCGNSQGAINLTVSGTGLTYLWNTNATTEDLSGLQAGTYICTITNSSGCTLVSNSIHVFDAPGTIEVSTQTIVHEVCGNGNGSINVNVSGGTGPMTYLWSNGSTSQDIYLLHASNYTITATDSIGCAFVYSESVDNIQGTIALQSVVITDETCGNTNGAINISISGGTTPYAYLWSNNATSQDLSGISAGTYSVTVHDVNGCELLYQETVSNIANSMTAVWQVTNEICTNASGAVDLTVSGGTVPYTFLWSNSSTTEDLSALAAGNYSCTVTDNAGCKIHTGPIAVNNFSAGMTATSVVTDETCNQSNGAIDITVSGGVSPFIYIWSNAAATQDLSGLSGGTYSFTVTDINGCSVSGNAIVDSTSGNMALSAVITDETCNSNTGAVNLSVNGGVSPYSFLWSNAQSSEDLSGLTAGQYTCTVTDNTGCMLVSQPFTVADNPGTLGITGIAVTNEICNHNNGRINLTVVGGTTPYTFNWSNGIHTEDLNNLTAGLYSVTVIDASGCSAVSQAVVYDDNGSFGITASAITDEHCNDQTGAIDISVSGGTIPYTYLWSNSASTQDISAISEGNYQVYVTDASGCSDNQNFIVLNQGSDLALTNAIITQTICNASNGRIDISFSGGIAPYMFNWSNGSHLQNLSNVNAGNYSVTITDAFGCMTTGTWTVGNQPGTLVSASISADEYCGNSSGSIMVSTSGGATPYNFEWNNGSTVEDLSSLHAGNYSLTVTDYFGCEIILFDTVVNITSGISIVQDSLFNESCGQSDGAVYVTIQGGAAPYSILWNTGAITDDIAGLSAGNYSLTVTDATSCSQLMNVQIINNAGGMVLSYSNTQDEFCGHSDGFIDIEVTGGFAPYSYDWSNGDTTQDIILLSHGTYVVTVTDNNGCSMNSSFSIVNLTGSGILASAVVENTICISTTGSIDLSVTGGLQPLTFLWNNGSTSQDIFSVDDGSYSVIISDAAGCSDTNTYVVDQDFNENLEFYYVWTENDNCWQSQGYVYWDGLGASFFTYLINDVPNANGYAPSLTTGWYEASIVDEFGCRLDSTVYVDNLATFNISGIASDELCGGNDGAIDLSVDGAGPYSYWWSNGAITEDLNGLSAGTYSVTVTDGSCSDDYAVTIGNEFDFATSISVINESCGDGTGSIDLSVNPYVTSTYSYLWSNGATTQDLNGISAGVYYCTVTRVSSGCSRIVSDTVFSVSSGLEIAALIESDSCSLGIGSCQILLTGGSGMYDYYWGHGPVLLSLNNLVAGDYTFTAIDMNDDCSTTEFIEIPDIRTFHASAILADASCSTCNDGMIDLTVTGVPGYTNAFTYSWSHGPTVQDGVSLTPGIYTVTISSSTGCDTTMTFEVKFPDIVSIDEANLNILQISPNPADGECVISWNIINGEKGVIQITDMNGRKLRRWKVSGEASTIFETALLAPGQYVVVLNTDSNVTRKKLVVAR
ncbi:MAG: hypothetical protein A2W93_04105 [Bacteroidetes bacterium GWF2_43_63]|nr:MAG: hypothetical protein A2W93_04105 [Bacteroidetes bacterium GWF2_43_63]HBG69245.1 hypothetical protein [Bacteroidales bacterium]